MDTKTTGVSPPQKQLNHETYAWFLQADINDPEWLVGGLIPNPGLVALTGKPGAFKTFIAQWIGLRLSAGLPLFDKYDQPPKTKLKKPYREPVNVIFVEEEMNRASIKDRCETLRMFGEGNNFHWFLSNGFNLQKPEMVRQLQEKIVEYGAKLIVLDPFTSVSAMVDENSNSEARKIMDIIRHEFVDNELGCTVIIIHHPAKSDEAKNSVRGAGDITGKLDLHLTVQKKEKTKILIKCEKNRLSKDYFSFYAEMREEPNDWGRMEWVFVGDERAEETRQENEREEAEEQEMIKYMRTRVTWTKKELSEIMGVSRNGKKFNETFERLKQKEIVLEHPTLGILLKEKMNTE